MARRRAFVERSCYVANPNPAFSAPGHHKPHRPKFIKSCMNLAASRDVCSWADSPYWRRLPAVVAISMCTRDGA
ncbi:hypothetical protein H2136_20360 [Aeromonas hydrophila]|uniref:Uncharacterized protein n=1 Tax=Aeromonas hydrophila TaxID=644 RepID=A0A926FPP8_AERHY|nr:hypothetical protein [Aeromonas hydrophila]